MQRNLSGGVYFDIREATSYSVATQGGVVVYKGYSHHIARLLANVFGLV